MPEFTCSGYGLQEYLCSGYGMQEYTCSGYGIIRPAACRASLALGVADHLEVEFRLGARRCEASPALGMVDHPLMELNVLKLSNKV